MPDDLCVIRHFSFHHLHFPQIISPLTVSASGAFLEAIACWWYRLSLFQKIRHILRGFSQCVSFCLALRARGYRSRNRLYARVFPQRQSRQVHPRLVCMAKHIVWRTHSKTGERGQARLAEQHTVKKHLSPLDSVDECNNQPLQGEYYHSSLPSSSGK